MENKVMRVDEKFTFAGVDFVVKQVSNIIPDRPVYKCYKVDDLPYGEKYTFTYDNQGRLILCF